MTGNDPLFWTKVAGAILCAVMLATMTHVIAGFLYSPKTLDKPAYAIAGEATAAQPAAKAVTKPAEKAEAKPAEKPEVATAPAAKPAAPDSVLAMLGGADTARGKKLSKKCAACHSFNKGGPNKVGPNIWNIVGAKQAGVAKYKYSAALKRLGGTWDYAALDAYLLKPRAYAKGTKMSFAGLAKAKDRADLIGYLRGLSDNPKPLP